MGVPADLERRFAALDERLGPVAYQPVDPNKPGWLERLSDLTNPLDQAGVRSDAEALVADAIELYRTGNEEDRREVRRLFECYDALAWAASVRAPAASAEGFRQHLVLFSMTGHTVDPRDAISSLTDLCAIAKDAGVETVPILKEVARLSSDADIGMQTSVRRLLLRFC